MILKIIMILFVSIPVISQIVNEIHFDTISRPIVDNSMDSCEVAIKKEVLKCIALFNEGFPEKFIEKVKEISYSSTISIIKSRTPNPFSASFQFMIEEKEYILIYILDNSRTRIKKVVYSGILDKGFYYFNLTGVDDFGESLELIENIILVRDI